MKTKKYKDGQEVYVVSHTDAYYYTLHQQDVEDIKNGEWIGAGLKIVKDPKVSKRPCSNYVAIRDI